MKKLFISVALLAISFTTLCAQTSVCNKVSPGVMSLLTEKQASQQGMRAPVKQDISVSALVKFAAGADMNALASKYNFLIENKIGDVYIVNIPLESITPMAADDDVLRIEAERAPRLMTDLVPSQIGADKAHNGTVNNLPLSYTGKGVVVGIVDSGFDFMHPMFDEKGTKRSTATSDYSSETVWSPRVRWVTDYVVNKKYTTPDEILAAQHSSDATTMLHGTHVTGIAAGTPVNDLDDVTYSGIAYEADIALGAVNSEIAADGSGISSTQIIKALSDIFDYASEQGKPCVINLSMGDAMTFSNSHQLHTEAIRTLLQTPGRALVVSAGNFGGTKRLAHKEASVAEGGSGVCFNDYEQYGTYFGVELKVKPTQTVRLRLTTSNYASDKGEVTKTVEELENLGSLTLGTKRLTVQLREKTEDYDVIYITGGMNTYALTERILLTIAGEGDAWIYADPLCAQLENVAAIEGHSIAQYGYSMTCPADIDEVIAVGNVAHRLKIRTAANKYSGTQYTDLTEYESTKGEGFIAKSSSVGPTLTGLTKPDVCAPGVNIVSALNNFINENTDMEYAGWFISHLDTEYEDNYGYSMTLAQTGTSMSAPAVTGTIALWMQADPTLTVDRIKDVIAHASRLPEADWNYPNDTYGYGEIDAYQGLVYLTGNESLKGDIDMNGEVNTTDVTRLYNVIFGTDTTTDKSICNIDDSEDPNPNTTDVTALYNIIFGTYGK